ncbi:hypothetical protein BDQ17DRAFT_417067 [Cyathus striatus]|nr:hypothetical protein BDQ17DRAFT_417067 [Cyathus striatus]
MDTSSTASPSAIADDETCDVEDWEDLKELFAKAAEVYEADDPNETLPLLRGVIHECHRFLLFYQDPSVLFMNNRILAKKEEPPQYFELKEWAGFPPPDKVKARSQSRAPLKSPTPPLKKCKCLDLPTAFHTILGTALFFFGTLIAQSPELALAGEPPSPLPYWLAALDVFETGETLPTRTSNAICESMPEDWRMAVIWGRTLVSLSEEVIRRENEERKKGNPDIGVASEFCAEEPEWPHESPFSAIAARRPPVTRRMSMAGSSANEILVLAMDQFSRGIFHMPHAHNRRSPLPTTSYFSHLPPAVPTPATSPSTPGSSDLTFSRAKELYTIATEMLLVAEKLAVPSERAHWASWADSVFQQMKMEVDTDEAWRSLILQSRGRAWLVVGSARSEDLEDALERGDEGVLAGMEAQDARESLEMAMEFFEKAMEASSSPSTLHTVHSHAGAGTSSSSRVERMDRMDEDQEEEDREELRRLLAEVLVTLANLTVEEERRELFVLDGDEMDVE